MMKFSDFVLLEVSHKDGTYVMATLDKDSQSKLDAWVTAHKIENPYDPSEYHSTIVYSRKGIPDVKNYKFKTPFSGKIDSWKVFDTQEGKKALVGHVTSMDLTKYHTDLRRDYGATHDFPSYEPHVTISYDHQGEIPTDIPDFKITYDTVVVKPLNLDYKPKTKDEK